MKEEETSLGTSDAWSACFSSFRAALGRSETDTDLHRERDFPKLALAEIERNPTSLDQITDLVIPSKTLTPLEFYNRLDSLRRVLPFGREVRELISLVWRKALLRFPETHQEAILTAFPRTPEPNLFDYLDALPSILGSIPVAAKRARHWFQRIRNALGQNGADSGYWLGIESWTERDPLNAYVLLEELSESRADDQELWCGARILATLRRLGELCPKEVPIAQIEPAWPVDSSVTKRLIHHRSWIETARGRALSDAEVRCLLSRLEEAETRETDAGFELLRVLVFTARLPETCVDLMIDWLGKHCRINSSAPGLYTCCLVAQKALEEGDPTWSPPQRRKLFDLIIDIQPIPENHGGAWMQMDHLLVALFQKSEEGTTDFLVRLNDSNPVGVRRLLDPFSRSGMAFRELAGWSGLPTLLLELFSSSMSRRRLGLSLINSGLPVMLDKAALASLPDSNIALGLLQIRLDHLRTETACSLLLQLIPRVEGASKDLQELLHHELVYQAKNLPGLCLEAFKQVKRPRKLLKEAILEADTYFQRLRIGAESPLAAMCVPGLTAARRALARRRQRTIQEAARKSSVFLEFMNSVTLPYGTEGFTSYMQGTLMPPTSFRSHSTSTEMPRLDLMDSDGRKLRQHHALQQIRVIEAESSNQQ
jgi:hypothetical protein